ncbi:hypothetical protein ACLOJK_005344 [Asimina triloba]
MCLLVSPCQETQKFPLGNILVWLREEVMNVLEMFQSQSLKLAINYARAVGLNAPGCLFLDELEVDDSPSLVEADIETIEDLTKWPSDFLDEELYDTNEEPTYHGLSFT